MPRRIKVLHVVPLLVFGGIRRHLEYFYAFGTESLEVTLVVLFSVPDRQHVPIPGLKTIFLNHIPGDESLRPIIFMQLVDIIRNERPDVVHSHHFFTDEHALLAAHEVGTPSIIRTIHGIHQITNLRTLQKLFVRSDWGYDECRSMRELDELCTFTVSVSDDLASKLRGRCVDPEKLRVIRNGVDTNCFLPSGRPTVRRISSRPIIGFLGRFDPCKNIESIIKLAEFLRSEGLHPFFAVLGEGPQESVFKRGLARLGILQDVAFFRPTVYVQRFLHLLDALFVPSLEEGCPYVILEAMATRVPIVASSTGGIPEIVTHGDNALLFPRGDINEAARMLRELRTESYLSSDLSYAARAAATAHHQARARVNELAVLYGESLS